MAWIKLRTDLLNDPAVYRLAAELKLDRYAIVGRLAAFWGWADQHAVDGAVDGASSQVVDDVVSLPGFADALARVKWLILDADKVTIPNHDRHNGGNAKERSLKSERQAKWRAKQAPEKPAKTVDAPVDGKPSLEERREEKRRNTPKAPKGASARFAEFWLTWPKSVRKHDKAKCEEAWQAQELDAQADAILADVRFKRGSPKWTAKSEDGNDFIEEPLRYLRNKRWEDGAEAADERPTLLAGAV